MRVFQTGDDARLALEAFQKAVIFCEGVVQDLDGDMSIQPLVVRLVDRRHAASANLRDNLVTGDTVPCA